MKRFILAVISSVSEVVFILTLFIMLLLHVNAENVVKTTCIVSFLCFVLSETVLILMETPETE